MGVLALRSSGYIQVNKHLRNPLEQNASVEIKDLSMKRVITFFGVIFLLSIILQSCKPDDIYHDLSDDAKGFVNFEIGNTFKLKNSITNEVITLNVITKNILYESNGSGGSSFISFGVSPAETYVQRGTYSFTDSSNCYKGEISVVANEQGGYKLTARIYGCFDNLGSGYEYNNTFFSTIDVEGVQYQNAYLLNSSPNVLYYSKERGILKIVNQSNNVTLFSYVE